MTRVRAVPPVTLEAGGPVQLRKAGTAAAAGKVFRRRKDTTEQADSERYMNTARR